MKFKTDLISGAGNTFHVTYAASHSILKLDHPFEKMKFVAKLICEKQKADGFIFLEKAENAPDESAENFKWYFYNNDGSDAEMCGNATRCVGFYLKNRIKSEKSNWNLKTSAGKIKIQGVGANQFKVIMSPVQTLKSTKGFFCDTGVPHLTLESKDENLFSNLEDLKIISSQLRHDSEFLKGTNVTYVFFEKEKRRIKAVSFERGVEDFTEACGTGAMAAAYFNLTTQGVTETEVEMPGGTLIMNLKDLNNPTMTGPAEFLGSYENELTV